MLLLALWNFSRLRYNSYTVCTHVPSKLFAKNDEVYERFDDDGRRRCMFLNRQSNAMFNLLLWILSAVRCTNSLCTQYIIHAVVHARAHLFRLSNDLNGVYIYVRMNVLLCDDDYCKFLHDSYGYH